MVGDLVKAKGPVLPCYSAVAVAFAFVERKPLPMIVAGADYWCNGDFEAFALVPPHTAGGNL